MRIVNKCKMGTFMSNLIVIILIIFSGFFGYTEILHIKDKKDESFVLQNCELYCHLRNETYEWVEYQSWMQWGIIPRVSVFCRCRDNKYEYAISASTMRKEIRERGKGFLIYIQR